MKMAMLFGRSAMKVEELLEAVEPFVIRMIRQRLAKGDKVGWYKTSYRTEKKTVVWIHDRWIRYESKDVARPTWNFYTQDFKGTHNKRIFDADINDWVLVPHTTMKNAWILQREKEQIE